ncbi:MULTISPECIES: CYTH domain-containing protein [Methylosinus]|uniref:CYTH domain-containing protein n=1 Tax=Methylosinus trichosporium (strain ATCC 35070 / NCIMB 11131 / UNIQEM 75 / OB3b) TaxID=595536 RepID=A0A2D2D404_METT3|nr:MULTISPECIES: CYTH domain-containing protein [Methylosinus]ATQ69722.1 CYTH domain-containing protein [Methylosinus trichosporium OB3b]OBS52479.1 adenylate cyclase [Methylosinus sp. 3S-1]
MALEIERKFLVDRDLWRPRHDGTFYRQGYLSRAEDRVVRVRALAGRAAFLTIKGRSAGLSRIELEYPIPVEDAELMLDRLCERPLIEKTRYEETVGGRLWTVDVFQGENDGLILAEIELSSESESFERPAWLGREVSDDPRYFNSELSKQPFGYWKTP